MHRPRVQALTGGPLLCAGRGVWQGGTVEAGCGSGLSCAGPTRAGRPEVGPLMRGAV